MFLADNLRIASIKGRQSLLKYEGLQPYKVYREEIFRNVCLSIHFELRFCSQKFATHLIFSRRQQNRIS